ncbi:NDP-hexose 2,3-dehydratase family protein [Glaciecola sp. MH2013]|uniref:NDP-hexose 2,3-dehydratase family protein n=1 Tax=Glaciecola sp. MH2013 TaxID=2785524 RepID=UPI00189D5270|nr:NDP-hexose 2,3-dehydratase family protein [Glaciecola sp. MH2013]MBF7072226.1 NDP-hexose 2,3-dehydratase family protein [Glaciecola sp. MH2013]
MKVSFNEQYSLFLDKVKGFTDEPIYPHTIESFFESLNDWSQFHSLEDVKKWFIEKRKSSSLSVTNIPLNEVSGWKADPSTGNISHCSGDFFTVHGLRVNSKNREVDITWEQPILEQVGYDGGLLGIIKKRFNDVPHYLCEAKEEPGNYGKVQISPSLQATFANLNQAHGGRKPHFAELFMSREKNEDLNVLFDSWLAEDGGRLHLKRNRGILLEVPADEEIELPNDNFIWLSLYQIKQLLTEDAWINPHVRGILAHV